MTPRMTGFDSQFPTPEHDIIAITKQIWEDREIASLHRYDAPTIPVRSPGSVGHLPEPLAMPLPI